MFSGASSRRGSRHLNTRSIRSSVSDLRACDVVAVKYSYAYPSGEVFASLKRIFSDCNHYYTAIRDGSKNLELIELIAATKAYALVLLSHHRVDLAFGRVQLFWLFSQVILANKYLNRSPDILSLNAIMAKR